MLVRGSSRDEASPARRLLRGVCCEAAAARRCRGVTDSRGMVWEWCGECLTIRKPAWQMSSATAASMRRAGYTGHSRGRLRGGCETVRGGVVVSSGGAAFRDPRLFDRNNFTSLVTTVPDGAHPPPVRTPLRSPGRPARGGGPARTADRRRSTARRRASPHGAALSSRSDLLRPCSLVFRFAYFLLILALVYKIYITRCS